MTQFAHSLRAYALKGFASVIFSITICTSVMAQYTNFRKSVDITDFKKWEVSLDVKPLFRSDAPYNIMVKKHIDERRTWRLILGASNFSNQKVVYSAGSIDYDTTKLPNPIGTSVYPQSNQTTNTTYFSIKVGYQVELERMDRIAIYSASDLGLAYFNQSSDASSPNNTVQGYIYPANPFNGVPSVASDFTTLSTFSLTQSLGLKFPLNRRFSCSLETSISAQYVRSNNKIWKLLRAGTINPAIAPETQIQIFEGHQFNFILTPVMGLFINYYF